MRRYVVLCMGKGLAAVKGENGITRYFTPWSAMSRAHADGRALKRAASLFTLGAARQAVIEDIAQRNAMQASASVDDYQLLAVEVDP